MAGRVVDVTIHIDRTMYTYIHTRIYERAPFDTAQ